LAGTHAQCPKLVPVAGDIVAQRLCRNTGTVGQLLSRHCLHSVFVFLTEIPFLIFLAQNYFFFSRRFLFFTRAGFYFLLAQDFIFYSRRDAECTEFSQSSIFSSFKELTLSSLLILSIYSPCTLYIILCAKLRVLCGSAREYILPFARGFIFYSRRDAESTEFSQSFLSLFLLFITPKYPTLRQTLCTLRLCAWIIYSLCENKFCSLRD